MKLRGRVDRVLPEQSGVSKSGKAWRKRTVVLTYDVSNMNYPKSVVFDVVGDRIEKYNFEAGADYEIDVDFEVREWNGRYFQQVGVYGAARLGAQMQAQQQPQQYIQQAQAQQPFGGQVFPQEAQQQQSDDLPF